MIRMNVREVIDELKIVESKAGWPPNRKMYRKALVALGEKDEWGVGPLSYHDAVAKMNKERKQAGKDRWDNISKAIYEVMNSVQSSAATSSQTSGNQIGILNGAHLPAIMSGQEVKFADGYIVFDDYIRNLIIKGAHTSDNSGEEIIRLKKEYQELLERNQGDAQTQSMVIHEKDVEINNMREKIKGMSNQIRELAGKADVAESNMRAMSNDKDALRLEAENIELKEKVRSYNQLNERSQETNRKLNDTIDELEKKLSDKGIGLEMENKIQMLENEIAQFKMGSVTTDQVMSAIAMHRWLPDKASDKIDVPLSVGNFIRRYIQDLKEVIGRLDGIQKLYAESTKQGKSFMPGLICKELGFTIDDYGQVKQKGYPEVVDIANVLDIGIRRARECLVMAEEIADKTIN